MIEIWGVCFDLVKFFLFIDDRDRASIGWFSDKENRCICVEKDEMSDVLKDLGGRVEWQAIPQCSKRYNEIVVAVVAARLKGPDYMADIYDIRYEHCAFERTVTRVVLEGCEKDDERRFYPHHMKAGFPL